MQHSLLCCELSLHCSNSRAVDPPVLSCMLLYLWTTLKQALVGGFPMKTMSRDLHTKWILVHSQLTGSSGIPLLGDVPCFQQAPCSGSSSVPKHTSSPPFSTGSSQCPVTSALGNGHQETCLCVLQTQRKLGFSLPLAVFLGVSPVT